MEEHLVSEMKLVHIPIFKSPYVIRPFCVNEEDKSMIDKELQRLAHLGLLQQNISAYSSPIMLIARKNSNLNRMITDFRFLNSRFQRKFDLSFNLRCF